jgi:ABC-2 type transport system permease protein
VFSTILPVAFLTTVPAEAILGLANGGSLLAGLVLAGLSVVGSRALWRLALRHYTSASS